MRAGRALGCRRRRMQRAGKAPTVEAEVRARAKRTENMPLVLMTLDVSQLSGWLNAAANYRVARGGVERGGGMRGRGGRREGVGARRPPQAGCREVL